MGAWNFSGWVYNDKDGRQVGPVSGEELKKAIALGDVQPNDRVWTKWHNREEHLFPVLAKSVFGEEPTAPY